MHMNRRNFLKATAGAAALASVGVRGAFGANNRLPIAFSTLGCPAWELPKILDFAQQHGFAAIELRGLQGNMDLPTHPAFAAGQIAQTKKDFAGHGLKIACVSSSAMMGEADPAKRAKQIQDGKRFVDLAVELNAPYVRVFGKPDDSEKPVAPDEALRKRVADGLHELGEYSGPKNVTVILESHDDFTSSATLTEVLTEANSPHAALLWDAYHTFNTSHEPPAETVKALGKWIRHTHLKDGAGTGNDRKYVLTGTGDVPVKQQIALLHGIGYKGYYCFEWEKAWHPDLLDPEIAIANYAEVVSGYLREIQKS